MPQETILVPAPGELLALVVVVALVVAAVVLVVRFGKREVSAARELVSWPALLGSSAIASLLTIPLAVALLVLDSFLAPLSESPVVLVSPLVVAVLLAALAYAALALTARPAVRATLRVALMWACVFQALQPTAMVASAFLASIAGANGYLLSFMIWPAVWLSTFAVLASAHGRDGESAQ